MEYNVDVNKYEKITLWNDPVQLTAKIEYLKCKTYCVCARKDNQVINVQC